MKASDFWSGDILKAVRKDEPKIWCVFQYDRYTINYIHPIAGTVAYSVNNELHILDTSSGISIEHFNFTVLKGYNVTIASTDQDYVLLWAYELISAV